MFRILARLSILLLALAAFLPEFNRCLAQDEDPASLEQQARKLIQEHKYQEAIPIAEKLVEIREKEPGPESRETAESLDILAVLYTSQRQYAKAEPLYLAR